MYPFIRMATTMLSARRLPPLPPDGIHISDHRSMPWDLDTFGEVNNGRMLSLYDLGRFGLAVRVGLIGVLRREGWALTVAGSSVRYRHRLLAFQRYQTCSQALGRDARFMYLQQSMIRAGQTVSHGLFRTAVVGPGGLIPTDQVAQAMGAPGWNPALPPWVIAWAEAEAQRPWPPVFEAQFVNDPP